MWPKAPLPGYNNPPPPTLSEVVTTLRTLGKTELPKQLARWLDELDETGRWALLKLVTGAMRIGISARLAKTAAADLGHKDAHDVELMWPGLAPPYLDLFALLEVRHRKPRHPDPSVRLCRDRRRRKRFGRAAVRRAPGAAGGVRQEARRCQD